MTDGPHSAEMPAPPSPRSAKRRLTFVTLAGVLAIVGALAAGYYFAMRPVTLRIAVGPANSDDLKVVQTLTQAFNNQRTSLVRLRPVQTDGALASANLLGEGKVDLAIIRGDLDVPKNAQAVATLRKNVAVLWVPPAARTKGKKAAPAITKIGQLTGRRIGVVGRTQANVDLLKVILRQYGVDPAKVEIIQFPANEAAEAIRSQKADAYLAAGPVSSKITTDTIAASAREGGTPKFLAIDFGRGYCAEPSRLRGRQHPGRNIWQRAEPARGRDQDDKLLAPHRGAQGYRGIDHCRLYAAVVCDPPDAEE